MTAEMPEPIRRVTATRYVTPLREGGSVPAVMEADDFGIYVLKFRGAGQGERALIAELVSGEIGRFLGLPVPEIVLMDLDPILGRSEPDPEIRSLVQASGGLNLALDYLPGSFGYDPAVGGQVGPILASQVVWFDAFVTNVDRTARNPNLLMWHRKLYLIDHGASLYFHHSWDEYLERASGAFPQIKSHVLLPFATQIQSVAEQLRARLTSEILRSIVALIPDQWLTGEDRFSEPSQYRDAYVAYLLRRLEAAHVFEEEACRAHAALI